MVRGKRIEVRERRGSEAYGLTGKGDGSRYENVEGAKRTD